MRRFVPLAGAAVMSMMLAAPASAQKTFEGVIEYEMGSAGQSMSVVQSVKGDRIRQELQGPMGAMAMIIDTRTMDMTTLMPAQKMYMKMNMSDMLAQISAQHSLPDPDPADFKATGRKETIAGHECEHYTYSQDALEMDICAAKGLGFVPFATGGMQGRPGGGGLADMEKFRAHFKDGFLPLLVTGTNDGQTFEMRAKRVEAKSIDASIFTVPDGYTEMKIPGMPGR